MTTAPDGREPPGTEGQEGAAQAVPSAPVGEAERDYDAPVRDTETGWLGHLFLPLAVLAALVNLWANMFATLSDLWLGGLHFASFAMLCALRYPIWRSERPAWRRVALGLDLALAVILPAATIVLIEQENAIYDRGVHLSLPDWILAAITIFGAIELTRRVSGLIIPVIVIVALAYVGWWGELIGGVAHLDALRCLCANLPNPGELRNERLLAEFWLAHNGTAVRGFCHPDRTVAASRSETAASACTRLASVSTRYARPMAAVSPPCAAIWSKTSACLGLGSGLGVGVRVGVGLRLGLG